jgi:hypothetical protein
MSIQHLEDLALPAFIKAVRNIASFHASEKLDGANLWLGRDEDGKFFTSREGKRAQAKRFYAEAEYPNFGAYNGFRSAHAAMEARIEDINRIMQPGQMVEAEVLYGRQPNAVTYGAEGKSYIAFLRGVNGTPDVIADQLSTALGGTSVKVQANIVVTTDGENLDIHPTEVTFQFTGAQRVDPSKLKDINLTSHLDALEKFLNEPAGVEGVELTNGDLLFTSLGSIKVDVRPQAKDKKAEITAKIMTDFKLPVKKELLDNYVSKIKPALSDSDLTSDEDVGIEGVVLRDPTNGELIKLVDKDNFTTINSFNHAIRNQISGVVKTLDPNAPLEARGGILGNMKISIADLLGNAELSRGGTAKRAFAAVKGATPVDTVKAFSAQLEIDDFLGAKRKILALVQRAAMDLKTLLEDFKEHKDEFRLKLKNGRVIGITPEIEKRTLLAFAESRRNILELFDKIKKTKTVAQVIAVLYGHHAKAVHTVGDSEPVAEGLLFESKYDTDKARYSGKDAWTILNIYLATVMMSVIIYATKDAKGLRMLKDKTNYKLTSWSKEMSPLNFWGYPVWRASQPAVKKLIGNKNSQQIYKVARRAPAAAARYLHMDLSFGKDVPIDWSDHKKTLKLLQQFEGLNVDRINTLLDGVFDFEALSHDKQVKTIAKLYYYVQQFIPTSPLFIRLKAIQEELLLNANGENDQMVQEMKLLAEVNSLVEDDGDSTPQNQGSSLEVATKSADTASNTPAMPNKARKVVKRKRNPDVKKAKFPKPTDSTV